VVLIVAGLSERQKLALRALAFYEGDYLHGTAVLVFLRDNGYVRDDRPYWRGGKGWQNTLNSLANRRLVDVRYPSSAGPVPAGGTFRINDAGREALS
jgi:hypothetical protein